MIRIEMRAEEDSGSRLVVKQVIDSWDKRKRKKVSGYRNAQMSVDVQNARFEKIDDSP